MLLYCLLLLLNDVVGTIPTSERQALMDIYSSTNGNGWTDKQNWLTSQNECDWYGIKCDSKQTHVVQLLLQANNLTGSLPESIGNLTQVQVLSLDIPPNRIGGELPASIGNLKQLGVFTIASQNMGGAIPSTVGDLSSLSIMHFGGNHFSSIPVTISKLGPMSSFAIESNHMNGVSLPSQGPKFTGGIGECDLSGNTFKCPIPAWARDALCGATCT